jgi:hypothetical protein
MLISLERFRLQKHLLYKGAQLGTVLSFMMAVTTLSLPSLIMLRKAVKPKLLMDIYFDLYNWYYSGRVCIQCAAAFPGIERGSSYG